MVPSRRLAPDPGLVWTRYCGKKKTSFARPEIAERDPHELLLRIQLHHAPAPSKRCVTSEVARPRFPWSGWDLFSNFFHRVQPLVCVTKHRDVFRFLLKYK